MPTTVPLPPGYDTIRGAARRIGVNESTLRTRIKAGLCQTRLVPVTLELIPDSEIERMRGQTFYHSQKPPEPDPGEDFAAWQAWNKKTKKYGGFDS